MQLVNVFIGLTTPEGQGMHRLSSVDTSPIWVHVYPIWVIVYPIGCSCVHLGVCVSNLGV